MVSRSLRNATEPLRAVFIDFDGTLSADNDFSEDLLARCQRECGCSCTATAGDGSLSVLATTWPTANITEAFGGPERLQFLGGRSARRLQRERTHDCGSDGRSGDNTCSCGRGRIFAGRRRAVAELDARDDESECLMESFNPEPLSPLQSGQEPNRSGVLRWILRPPESIRVSLEAFWDHTCRHTCSQSDMQECHVLRCQVVGYSVH